VPLGTYTGWSVYRAQPCELCDRDGSLIPFARTRTERDAAADPRLSLEERYGSRENYIARVEAAAAALVADRLLLRTDAAAYINAAREMRSVLKSSAGADEFWFDLSGRELEMRKGMFMIGLTDLLRVSLFQTTVAAPIVRSITPIALDEPLLEEIYYYHGRYYPYHYNHRYYAHRVHGHGHWHYY
jgi:hypothetical protein